MSDSTPPPVDPSQLPNKGRNWPKTIGVIALIFGILGFLGAVVAPFSLLITKSALESMVSQGADPDAVETYIGKAQSIAYLSAAILGIVALLLLFGGIQLMKRKKIASPVLQVWAVLKVAAGGFLNYKNFHLTREQLEITNSVQAGNAEIAQMTESITTVSLIVGMVFGGLWLLALPVFLLVWLNRAKVKEEIQSW